MGEWLPIADAAPRLGVSKTALRRRVDRGSVEARKDTDGRWLVYVDAVYTEPAPQGTPRDTTQGIPADGSLAAVVEVLREQLGVKDQQIAEKDRQLAAREREISELHVMLQTAQRLIPAKVPEAAESRESREDESTNEPVREEGKTPQRVTERVPAPPQKRRGWLSRLFGLE